MSDDQSCSYGDDDIQAVVDALQDWSSQRAWKYKSYDIIELHGNRVLKTHGAADCTDEICVIHNQTQHHMQHWPLNWRDDRGIMERVCAHGIGHPDPDDRKIRLDIDPGVHGCDGCCAPPTH